MKKMSGRHRIFFFFFRRDFKPVGGGGGGEYSDIFIHT